MRGASAPGVGAVHMNGLYAALGGYRFLRRIELDDNLLIMAFERVDGGDDRERYAVAIASAQFPLTVSVLEADLSGIELSAFDFAGEGARLRSSTGIRVGEGALYLRSNDERLFDRLGVGRVAWGQSITGQIEERVGANAESVIYATGVPPVRASERGHMDRWTLLLDGEGAGADHDAGFPIRENITTKGGALIWPVNKTRLFAQPLPYVLLSAENPPETAWHRAHTSVESAQAGVATWYFSATGPATLWVNGKTRIDLSDQPHGLVGSTWRSLTVPIKEGLNHVLVQVASNGAPCAFALSADPEAINNAPVAVDGDGFIRKWRIIGPWKNWRNSAGKFRGNDFAFPPESRTDFLLHTTGLRKMPLIWHEASYATPVIPHPWVDGISYAHTVVEVDEDTPCLASVGSDDGFALWINGTFAGRNAVSRTFKMDSDKVPVVLKKGRNQVLFKIDDTGGAGSFALRFVHEDGRPVTLTSVD